MANLDYHDYIGEHVWIKQKNGKEIEGDIIGYEVGIVEDRDYDLIDVSPEEGYSIGIPIPDIIKFKVLE